MICIESIHMKDYAEMMSVMTTMMAVLWIVSYTKRGKQ